VPLRRLACAVSGIFGHLAPRRAWSGAQLVRILDLFEEHVYAGEITPDGRYVHHASIRSAGSLLGGAVPDGVEIGGFWESRIPAEDLEEYHAFNRRLLAGQDAEVTYRILGVDGVTRVVRDRARPRPMAGGGADVDGIISDITTWAEAAARVAEANRRFTSLLDVVGAHVYLALAHPDGTLEELFQGPGGDRLLGGAEPDPEMVNWDNAVWRTSCAGAWTPCRPRITSSSAHVRTPSCGPPRTTSPAPSTGATSSSSPPRWWNRRRSGAGCCWSTPTTSSTSTMPTATLSVTPS
jgi:hypothetical protein